MQSRLKIAIGLAVLAALAGCKERKPVPKAEAEASADPAAAELERFQAQENARSRVTMIDAATGDAAAMPAESSAPVQIDLVKANTSKTDEARKEAGEPTTGGTATAPGGPAAPIASPPAEEFPSVAQPTG